VTPLKKNIQILPPTLPIKKKKSPKKSKTPNKQPPKSKTPVKKKAKSPMKKK